MGNNNSVSLCYFLSKDDFQIQKVELKITFHCTHKCFLFLGMTDDKTGHRNCVVHRICNDESLNLCKLSYMYILSKGLLCLTTQ